MQLSTMLTNPSEVRKPQTSRPGSLIPRIRAGFGTTLTLIAVVAIVLRLTIRDLYWPFAWLYYGTPPVVLTGIWLCAAACYDRRHRLGSTLGALTLAAVCAAWTYQTMWFHAEQESAGEETTRIVMWNTARGMFGWEPIARQTAAFDADVLCLAEAGRASPAQREMWRQAFPDYHHSNLWHGTLVLARTELETIELGRMGKDIAYQICRIETGSGPLIVALIDIHSDPLRWRRAAFRKLVNVLAPYRGQPMVVLGDFNTPPDSAWHDLLRTRLRSAFEEAGNGYAATWPHPLPVLTLDQIWVSPEVGLHTCKTIGSWASDHRAIMTEVSLGGE